MLNIYNDPQPTTADGAAATGAIGRIVRTAESSPEAGFDINASAGAQLGSSSIATVQGFNVSTTLGVILLLGGVLFAADRLL